MTEASNAVVSMIAGQLQPIGMTLTQEEGEAIMERVRANVMGAVHAGCTRTSLEGVAYVRNQQG